MTKIQRYLVCGLPAVVTIFLADRFARLGYPVISWFLGGVIMAVATQFAFGQPGKRRVGRILLAMSLSGAAGGLVAFLVYGFGLW